MPVIKKRNAGVCVPLKAMTRQLIINMSRCYYNGTTFIIRRMSSPSAGQMLILQRKYSTNPAKILDVLMNAWSVRNLALLSYRNLR